MADACLKCDNVNRSLLVAAPFTVVKPKPAKLHQPCRKPRLCERPRGGESSETPLFPDGWDFEDTQVNRHPPPRVPGPAPVLDNRRSREQAARFQDLFQPSSRAYRTLGPTTRGRTAGADREAPIVPMGISLPRPVSNTDSCLIPQLRLFADWTIGPRRRYALGVNRISQVSATAIKSASNINSPATGTQ